MSDATRSVRLGFAGIGGRGSTLLTRCLDMDDVDVPAVCDVQERHRESAADAVVDSGRGPPARYADYGEMLAEETLDGVVIATPWREHIPMAIEAMEAGVYPGMEVGPASSVEECWDLVATAERTGVPCMLLENACYGRDQMAVLRMVREGLFGELVHCQCGYQHDIRERIVTGKETSVEEADGLDYRTLHNRKRNGDIYPTHGVGPVATYLDVNRGNRFVSLSSVASKSRGLNDWAEKNLPEDHPDADADWAIGDVVTTTIRCANGETVVVNHDCSLPRPYSKMFRVQGTNGLWMEDGDTVYVEGRSPEHEWESFEEYREEFDHPLWERYREQGVKSGHGGSDHLVLRDYVTAVERGVRPPIDVYDAAAWMAITPLSERSIALGSEPVDFPDFTNGAWLSNEPRFGRTASDAVPYPIQEIL